MSSAVADTPSDTLFPQRPRYFRERPEQDGWLVEPEWKGERVLVRLGHPEPRFMGYDGPADGPLALYEAIASEVSGRTAVIDGVLVSDFAEEPDLEVDTEGNAFVRPAAGRTIFAAFDLLELDGESFLEVPLLERKRHLEAVLRPSRNVRLTAYRGRDVRSWRDTLAEQGFRRVVMKDANSAYSPGTTTDRWVVVEKIREAGRR